MKRFLPMRLSFFTAVIAFCAGAASLSAQNSTIEVGLQPLSIVPVGERVHVFHNQVDLNFNGEQDEGDSPASWWVLNKEGQVLDSKNLEWGAMGYPFRPYVDTNAKAVYLSHLGRVRSFSLETQELLRDTVALYNASGIATHGDNLYVTVRPSFSDPGQFITYNVVTGEETVRTVGVNPQLIIPFKTSDNAEGMLILSEGGFGATPPSLLDKHYTDGTPAPAPLEIGGTGNHVAIQGNYAYVAMNGTYEVRVIDIKNWTIVTSIAVSTEPGNGPREIVVHGDDLFVSTFDNDVRMFSIASGEQRTSYEPGGRPEGMALIDGKLWIANAFKAGSFESDNTIAVWDLSTTAVAGEVDNIRLVVAPSVVTDEAVVSIPFFSTARIEIVSALGECIGEINNGSVEGGVYQARFVPASYQLSTGRYFLRIHTGAVVRTVPVVVVR